MTNEELLERIKALEERIDELESALYDKIAEAERSLEHRIGHVEDDVIRVERSVDHLERA